MAMYAGIRESTDHMALTLARHVITTEAKGKNLVISPVSFHVVLGLIAAGSKGPTQKQVLGFLNSKSIEEDKSVVSQLVTSILTDGGALGGPRLAFANGVWVDQSLTLKPEFDDVVKNCYKADLSLVDFKTKADEVLRTVNEWVEDETNGLVRDILPPGSVDDSTQLILANALYFKGAWEEKFAPSWTKEHEFFLSNDTDDSVRVPFMTSSYEQYVEAYDGFKVLRLHYEQGESKRRSFSMYVFLPDARDGLPDLVRKMGSSALFIERHIPYRKVDLKDFRIPKFKFGFGFEASGALKELGLVLPFEGEGLTEMVDSVLRVSAIFHKSRVEVNEEGTEAAAATVVVFEPTACGYPSDEEEEIDFVADHPFLFVVREDHSGSILFVGQVVNPLDD